MAYENYSNVSWTTGTPITGTRLAQMSTNIEQVKDATSGKPDGLLKIKEISSNIVVSSNVFNAFELISLKDETGTGGLNYTVTVDDSRYCRLNLNFPGFFIANAGGEDSTYFLSFNKGIYGGAVTELANYKFSPAPMLFTNIATGTANITKVSFTLANIASTGPNNNTNVANIRINNSNISNASLASNIQLKSSQIIGAGTYQYVFTTSGITNTTFHIKAGKVAGASGSNNGTAYTIISASPSVMQFYIEDLGA